MCTEEKASSTNVGATPTTPKFPFDIIVVTSPNTTAAEAAAAGPLQDISDKFPHVKIISTSDPFGVRCGSGGGTLAALHIADSSVDDVSQESPKQPPSVLIVHAGGQSSRCPTQMALGKAWTSLPLDDHIVGNPTFMLIESLGRLLEDSPQGTVAVAASDVLLSLEDEHHDTAKLNFTQLLSSVKENDSDETSATAQQQQQQSQYQDVVVGLAVPAPLDTAQNHGVYVLQDHEELDNNNNNDNNDDDLNVKIRQVSQFLQKPTVSQMKSTSCCTFDSTEHEHEESAWIDTGVVCFLPKAAQGLRRLANEELKCCTHQGLQQLYNEYCSEQDPNSSEMITLEEFSTQTTLRIELYSHIMFALSTCTISSSEKHTRTLKSYMENQSDADDRLPPEILKCMFEELSKYQLKTCIIPTGAFVHLGTTKEMLDFMRHGASWKRLLKKSNSMESDYDEALPLDISDSVASHRCQVFGRRIKMAPRSRSFLQLPFLGDDDDHLNENDLERVEANTTMKTDSHHDISSSNFHASFNSSMKDVLHHTSESSLLSSPRSSRRIRSGSFLELSSNHTNGTSLTRKRSGSFLETTLLANNNKNGKTTTKSKSFVSSSRNGSIDSSCVVLNSILTIYQDGQETKVMNDTNEETTSTSSIAPTTGSKIGHGSVVEHTILTCPSGIHIGQHCLLSGARGYAPSKIDIPNGMCLQMLPLQRQQQNLESNATSTSSSMVYMYFGVHDDIKKCTTMYGMDMYYVLERTGLTLFDVWDKEILMKRKNTIWNAKLHPIVQDNNKDHDDTSTMPIFRHGELFSWITCLLQQSKDKVLPQHAIESLMAWKDLPRLSLSSIRDMADAAEEFKYRHEIEVCVQTKKEQYMDNIRSVLLERRHEEIRFDVILDDIVTMSPSDAGVDEFLLDVIAVMDDVIKEGIQQSRYDISSRTLMVMSLLLADIAQLMTVSQEEQLLLDHVNHDNNNHDIDHDIDILRNSSSTTQAKLDAFENLKLHRNYLVFNGEEKQFSSSPSCPRAWIKCASTLEKAGLVFISTCVSVSTSGSQKYTQRTLPPAPIDTWVVASAPARVDLAGGWSDTPPLSYEYGGAVTGIAVKVDGKNPLSARCRKVSGSNKGIVLRTEGRDFDETLLSHTEVTLHTLGDLSDFQNPLAECALLKCALLFFKLVPMDNIIAKDENVDLQPFINSFCGSQDEDVGLEIVCTSRLPRGSGMGTSSILGGCILASIGRCIGIFDAEKADDSYLIEAVLTLEQLLSTGGGWQDQVMGLIEGLKTGTSDAHVIPLKTGVNRIPIQDSVRKELDKRLILAYTGQTRLAKDILQNVLRRWARRSPDIVSTVQNLVNGATSAAQAVNEGDLNKLGDCVNDYWTYKKIMAGEDSGVEPPVVKELLDELTERNEIVGGSLCGAGGGGFMVLLASAGGSGAEVEQLVKKELNGVIPDLALFTWHECSLSDQGLSLTLKK